MTIEFTIITALQTALKNLYQLDISIQDISLQFTRKEFKGDYTFVVFPFVKAIRQAPDKIASTLGLYLQREVKDITGFNVVNGYLNICISNNYWKTFLHRQYDNSHFGETPAREQAPILIEFSSPNTNKPLHLGHVRNNLLGDSIAKILTACGQRVVKVNLVNDKGIHICKSMIAWQQYSGGETPETSGMKGDHLAGKYYVLFDYHYKAEQKELVERGFSKEEAAQQAPIMMAAREMLRKWEDGDPDIRRLWQTMNGWVYEGFEKTYRRLDIRFDKTYYESDTYLLGKSLVQEGLEKGVFYRHEDGSVRVNLTQDGLDEKILLRKDGTSVYITQDLGTARLRYEEFHPQKMIYVVGNEQKYHFDVLKIVLSDKLHKEFGKSIYHLSYGMVDLPSGKMKSREGTVVDADDLMDDMFQEAKKSTESLGKFNFRPEEADTLYEMVGLGALKYFILKVDPQKNILFNPAESIDFNGNTAPFIQYTHARIQSLLRKANEQQIDFNAILPDELVLREEEKTFIKTLYQYPQIIQTSGESLNPAIIANYVYDLAKQYNHFYQETPVLRETDADRRRLLLQISQFVALVLRHGMSLLGIGVPDKM